MLQKRLNIFKSLYNMFGLGKKTIHVSYKFAGINPSVSPKSIKRAHQKTILKKLKTKNLGKPLKKFIGDRIKFYLEIRSWKGIRHNKKYPIRGQRTHTNAKTKKKLKFY